MIVIPRKNYEELLRTSKRKFRTELDRDLDEAIEQVKRGEMFGPFDNAKDLIKSLRSNKKIK